MKHIPIVILNRDRLMPLIKLVNILNKKGYNNIIIIDNGSTYGPLLEWYKTSEIDVFINNIPETLFDTGTFYRLAMTIKHPKFENIIKDYYVFTDSDVVPIDDIPDNFIDNMIEICKQYGKHKVGLGLKIDDLPQDNPISKNIIEIESQYWSNKIPDDNYDLYNAPIDTTFAVYSPNSEPLWGNNSFRMGGDYTAKHYPWYYYTDDLPEDEFYYIKHVEGGKGPVYSMKIKDIIESKK